MQKLWLSLCFTGCTRLAWYCTAAIFFLTEDCNQHYMASTTRFIHDRVREHLNNDNSSVKIHTSKCQNKVYKGIEVKTIVLENDAQIYDCSKRFTFETANLPSTPERNAANLRTFYSNNYFNISRDSLCFGTRPLDHTIRFYSYLYLIISHVFPPPPPHSFAFHTF